MGFVIRFPFVFVIDYLGADWAQGLIAALPTVLTHSFEVMGGILPALGFALTIMVIGKKELIPFFFLGYFAVAYLNIPVMGMAIFGLIIALVLRMIMFPEAANAKVSAASSDETKEKSGILTKKDISKSFWLYYLRASAEPRLLRFHDPLPEEALSQEGRSLRGPQASPRLL